MQRLVPSLRYEPRRVFSPKPRRVFGPKPLLTLATLPPSPRCTLQVSNRKRADVLADLQSQGYARIGVAAAKKAGGGSKAADEAADEDEGAEEEGEDKAAEKGVAGSGFNYLLSMPIFRFGFPLPPRIIPLTPSQAPFSSSPTDRCCLAFRRCPLTSA